MKQLSPFRYEVVTGEKVRITVVPHGANGMVTVSRSGQAFVAVSGSPPTFEFTVSKPVDSKHRVIIRGDFLPDDETEALYAVSLRGDQGGGEFPGETIDRPDATDLDQFDQYTYRFRVTA